MSTKTSLCFKKDENPNENNETEAPLLLLKQSWMWNLLKASVMRRLV